MGKDNKKITIEVVRDSEDWLKRPPKLSVLKSGDDKPTLYGKSSFNSMNIGIRELNVLEGIQKQPPSDAWNFIPRVYGEGCISSLTLGRKVLGDTIQLFGGEKTDRIDVEIFCEPYEPTEKKRKKDIEKRGIDTSIHDYITLGCNGDKFFLDIHLRNQQTFDELLRRVGNGEIYSLGIIIDEIGKVAGLYRPEYDYEPEVDYSCGQSFCLLEDKNDISNLSDEELDLIPNRLHMDSYDFQLTSKFSIVDFTITFNPKWVTTEMYWSEDED